MSRILGSIVSAGEGFTATVREDTATGRVWYVADGDIDADGANGQHGAPAAYLANDKGTEALANGGMRIVGGKVICAQAWARDIVILGPDNHPKVFPGGIIASMSWYRDPDKRMDDPSAYVDSETVNYIVVPPLVIQATAGVVRGCKARVSLGDRFADCVVADKGPRNKIGELSIAAARALGLKSSPRTGGTEKPELMYELWPGVPAPGYELQRS